MLDLLSKLINIANSGQTTIETANQFQNESLATYWKDLNSKYIGCNDYHAYIVGLTKPDDLTGLSDLDLCWSKEAPSLYINDQKVITEKKNIFFIESYKSPNGVLNNCLSYKAPLYTRLKKIIGVVGLSLQINTNALYIGAPTTSSIDKILFFSQSKNLQGLSDRQKECLYYLTKGMTSKQIARVLQLSPRTVEHYIEFIKIKLGCFSRADLIEKILPT